MNENLVKFLFGFGGSIMLAHGLLKFFIHLTKYEKKKSVQNFKRKSEIANQITQLNEVIFFPEMSGVNRNPADYKFSKISQLLSLISRTKNSLDLCLYLLTLPELANIVISLKQTGVKVR